MAFFKLKKPAIRTISESNDYIAKEKYVNYDRDFLKFVFIICTVQFIYVCCCILYLLRHRSSRAVPYVRLRGR